MYKIEICPAPKPMQPCDDVYIVRYIGDKESGPWEYLHTNGQWYRDTSGTDNSSSGYFPNKQAAEEALTNVEK